MKTELKKAEKKILQTKLHWFTLVAPALITLVVSAVGFIIKSYGMLLAVPAVCFFMYKVIERNHNIWVVTSLRVIDEYGVFSNNTKESPLDKINNVSYRQTLGGKIFGYGDVEIQTAAETGSTTYSMVAKPKELKDTITHMQEEYKDQQIKKQAAELAGAISAGQQNLVRDVPGELEKLYTLMLKGILTEEEYNTRKTKILNS